VGAGQSLRLTQVAIKSRLFFGVEVNEIEHLVSTTVGRENISQRIRFWIPFGPFVLFPPNRFVARKHTDHDKAVGVLRERRKHGVDFLPAHKAGYANVWCGAHDLLLS
jgi:hypothetical protein